MNTRNFASIMPLQLKHAMLCLAAFMGLFFTSATYAAQAVATVSKNVVGVHEVFQLQVSIDDNVNTNALDLSVLKEHFNIGTPSASSGTQIINGTVSRSTEWTVALATKEIGEFTIPSFRIGASSTDPITITSLKTASDGQTNTATPDIKVMADLDKSSLYLGESAEYTVRVQLGEQIRQASLTAPSGDGLEVHQLGEDRQVETVLNGKRYLVVIRKYQITPTSAGNITLHGAEFSGTIIKGSRGFGSTLRLPFNKAAEQEVLHVKNKPAGYQGVWLPTEDLQLSQQWQPTTNSVKVGEPITRILTLRVKNIEQSRLPNLNLTYPSSVRVYSEKPVYGSDQGYTTMTLKQVIIPRQDGTLTLPSLAINWWDTANDKQQTSKVDGLSLTVMPGDNPSTIDNNTAAPVNLAPNTTANPQPTPTPQTAETANNPVWIWATGIFAGLWLLTIWLFINERNKRLALIASTTVLIPGTDKAIPSPLAGMRQAIKANDNIQLQYHMQRWQQAQPNHPQEQQVRKLISAIMASSYAAKQSTENGKKDESVKEAQKTLLSLLETIEKEPLRSQTDKKPALTPIEPE